VLYISNTLYPLLTPSGPIFFIFKPTTMKPLTFLSKPLLGLVLFCIASCGGKDDKKTTDTTTADSTTAGTTTSTNPAPSTITTTPQDMMVVIHKVANFNKWQTLFEAHDSMKLANGVHNYVIGRGFKDSNTILVATKVDDMTKAKAFAKNPSLKKAMQQSGVVGAPAISFATMTYQDTATLNYDLRSRTTFTVKDWDRWQRSFDSAYQTKLDNGLVLRAYGHDADDNHKVTLVMAIKDTAKAFAYWKSDELKKRRAASGVTSEPVRFIYHMVKRY
jgi:hypothetical protein